MNFCKGLLYILDNKLFTVMSYSWLIQMESDISQTEVIETLQSQLTRARDDLQTKVDYVL